jgi:RNA polymerase sigma-70 factor (ECF subfamily)
MGGRAESGCNGADFVKVGRTVCAQNINSWFLDEVLPLEAMLTTFLRRSVREPGVVADLRQEVYVRVYEAALRKIPHPVRPFLLATARNLVIDRARRNQVVSIEAVVDLAELEIAADDPGPERSIAARQELRRLQAALDRLPPRCREALTLRKVEGLQRKEIARRMGISEPTVAKHLAAGMYVLAEFLNGEDVSGSKS